MDAVAYLRQMNRRLGTMPNAPDAYIIAFMLIKAFGHTIPWWAWVIFGIEVIVALTAATQELMEKEKDG